MFPKNNFCPQFSFLWTQMRILLAFCRNKLAFSAYKLVFCTHNLPFCGQRLIFCGHKCECYGHYLVFCRPKLAFFISILYVQSSMFVQLAFCCHNLATCVHKLAFCWQKLVFRAEKLVFCHREHLCAQINICWAPISNQGWFILKC